MTNVYIIKYLDYFIQVKVEFIFYFFVINNFKIFINLLRIKRLLHSINKE